ncbi:hypothetical protein [Prevotella communis]|nr:hypothetical protein [Prevotella communis]
MKKVAIIIIILCSCINSCKCQVKNGAWIEERFALDIMERKVVNGTYLFPIVGFEKIDGNLFVLTYGGESHPITISNEKEDVGQIIDFAFAINTQEWPKDSIEKYSKADYFIKVEENVIELTVACSEKKEKYRYIGRFGDSRFKSILEIKGWLLNYLIQPAI